MDIKQITINNMIEWLKENSFLCYNLSTITQELQFYSEQPLPAWYPTTIHLENATLSYNAITHELWIIKYDPTLNPDILQYSYAVDYLWLLISDSDLVNINSETKSQKMNTLIDHGIGLITISTDEKLVDIKERFRISINAKVRYVDQSFRLAIFNVIPGLQSLKYQPYWVNFYKTNISTECPAIITESMDESPGINHKIKDYTAHLTKQKFEKGTIPALDTTSTESLDNNQQPVNNIHDIDSLIQWGIQNTKFPIDSPNHVVNAIEALGYSDNCDYDKVREEIHKLTKGSVVWNKCTELHNMINIISQN
ncbi:MAG: hypothetical protein ACXAC7_10625 [Candidatus Hodarchaeales archaeon]|jgi:hypothetical protein